MAAEPEPLSAPAPTPAASPTPARWRTRLTSLGAALLVLALFYCALLASLRDTSATFDEPGHAAAGYVYWKYGDYRLDPENGNLSKRWIALPYLFRSDAFPAQTHAGWQASSAWILSDAWFNRMNNDTAGMLAAGRAFAALSAVALGMVVWFWSRRLFGPLGGMISLLLFATSPIILANGGLMTSDMPTALGFTAALGCIWATLQRITPWRVAGGTVAIAALFLFKMSAPLLLPVALLLAIARVADGRPLPAGRRLFTRRWQQAGVFGAVACAQTLGVVCLVWSAYDFRYSAFSSQTPGIHRFKDPWEHYLGYPPPREVLAELELTEEQKSRIQHQTALWGGTNAKWNHGIVADYAKFRETIFTPAQNEIYDSLMEPDTWHLIPWVLNFALEYHLLPEAFIAGYAHVWKTSDNNPAFFNGRVSEQGWFGFFPYLFAVKTPLPFFGLLGVSGLIAVAWWRSPRARAAEPPAHTLWRGLYPVLPLLALSAIYWATVLRSTLNIGHRHLLPAYPPLFILGGALALLWAPAGSALLAPALGRRLRWVACGLSLLLGLEMAYRYPRYIAYFNGLVTPDQGYRHVVDSSLDWGQELPAVARFLDEHKGEKAHFAYFGVGEPANYGIRAQYIGGMPGTAAKIYPPITPLLGTTKEKVVAFLKEHPNYNDQLVLNLNRGDDQINAGLIYRSAEHRLGAGLYLISATMLQGVYHGKAGGPWRPELEEHYRKLSEWLNPFFHDDRKAILQATPNLPLAVWNTNFEDYYNIRLSRLTAYLRKREPIAIINHAVLVYRLTEAEVEQALNGPVL